MSEPQSPWRDGVPPATTDVERRAAELIGLTHQISARPVELSAGWERVLERATQRQRSVLTLVVAGLAAVFLGVVGTSAVLSARRPAVVAASGAQWEWQQSGVVQLQRGRVQSVRRVSLRLESPQVSIIARECSFAAEVIAEGTRVTVFEGEAVVRGGDGVERTIGTGESVLWPAVPAIAPSLVPSAPAASTEAGCSDVPCFEGLAAGDDLKAEVALFELARRQPSRSVARLRESLTRFPDGVFVPEVRLALLVELTREARVAEALEVAKAFEAATPDDPRVEDVRALRQQLEWLSRKR